MASPEALLEKANKKVEEKHNVVADREWVVEGFDRWVEDLRERGGLEVKEEREEGVGGVGGRGEEGGRSEGHANNLPSPPSFPPNPPPPNLQHLLHIIHSRGLASDREARGLQ